MTAIAQAIAYSATIGGDTLADLGPISCGASVEGKTSRATLTVYSDPGVLDAGADVIVTIMVNGDSATLFRGDYTGQTWTLDAGQTWNIECVGIFARLAKPWGGPDRVYSPETTTTDDERVDAAIIRNLIEAYGIDSARHEVFESEWENPTGPEDPPIQWLLGEIQPVTLKNDEPAQGLIEHIDEVPGFATYDQLQGYIQRARYNTYYADPSATTATFVEGEDGVRITRLGPSYGNIQNRVIVQGLTYEGVPVEAGDQAENADLDKFYPPELRPAYIGREIRSDLIEFPHFALQCAAIQVQDTNRTTDGFEIVLAGDPAQHTLELQDTVVVDYPSGAAGPTRHRIISIQHELTPDPWSFVTTIRTNGGTLV